MSARTWSATPGPSGRTPRSPRRPALICCSRHRRRRSTRPASRRPSRCSGSPTASRARRGAAARLRTAEGERSTDALLRAAREAMLPFDVSPEYLALVDPETLEPLVELTARGLLAIAARIGGVRLIDNELLQPAQVPVPTTT